MEQRVDASESTSRSLIERAAKMDAAAWDRMSAIYGPLVYQWCRRSGLQPHDASDVMQDVFRALLKGLKTFRLERPEDTFRGWLWTVTRRKVLDHFRGQERNAAGAGGSTAHRRMAELPEQAPEDSDQEQAEVVRGELAQRAMALMQRDFEPRTWQAFWLTTIDGRSAAEAAESLGMTPAAVYMAKSRVLRRLREELAGLDLIE